MSATEAQTRITEPEFDAWLASAPKGDNLTYYRGFLYNDRQHASPASQGIDALALRVLAAATAGFVSLVQRRHGFHDYSYIAQRRAPRIHWTIPNG